MLKSNPSRVWPGLMAAALALIACQEKTASVSQSLSFETLQLQTDYQDYVRLIPSPDQAQVIYYVPTNGGVLIENGKPRLSVRQSGSALRVAGAFKTGGYDKVLGSLRSELKSQGFILAPAPIKKANADYLLAATRLPSGRFDVRCAESGAIRSCRIWDEDAERPGLGTTDIRRFQATFPTAATVADRMFFNFEVDAEPYRDLVQDFLNTGIEWDSFFIGKVDWLLNIRKPSGQLRLTIAWDRLAESARQAIRGCEGSCSAQELREWFKSQLEKPESIVQMREGQSQDIDFIFEHEIRPKLFVELIERGGSQDQEKRYFTLRLQADIENLGIQDLSWDVPQQDAGPGSQESLYRVECLNGAVDGALTLSPASSFCPL
jgi:hypothetical protein